jgi:hypothetical protein
MIRNMCIWAVLAALLLGFLSVELVQAGDADTESNSTKRRRIIYNDDADAQYPKFNAAATEGVEAFLAARFAPTVGTQVDTYFWCIGNGEDPPWGKKTPERIGDANQVMIDAARGAGMEIFASLRMNDIHDSWAEKLTYPLKAERPDLLIGRKSDQPYPKDSILSYFWSALDYAKQEVRDQKYAYIMDIAEKYDFDGFELDFFRHPLFFKPGEQHENLPVMTGFVHRVREGLSRIADKRGRPYLLAVRVPASEDQALRTGLDVRTWLADGLIDILIPNPAYQAFTANYKEFIDLGRHHGVPVYPCINCSSLNLEYTGSQDGAANRLRSVTSNFWALGADGVYVFNFFVPGDSDKENKWDGDAAHQWLNEIGSPETLRGLDKRYKVDHGTRTVEYLGFADAPDPFPVRLIDGTPIDLVIGDDLSKTENIESMNLRIFVGEVKESEGIQVFINGKPLPPESIERKDVDVFSAAVSSPIKRGVNSIVVLPGPGSLARFASRVNHVELIVDYE